MTESKLHELLRIAINASIKGGEEILEVYKDTITVEYKEDKSPLTKADKQSNEAIMAYLNETEVPVLSEEGKELTYQERKDWNYLWVVDPLDGTKEFIKRNGEFTVNVALVHNQLPILGVIYVPVEKTLYFGLQGLGSYKTKNIETLQEDLDILIGNSIRLPEQQERRYTMVGSRSHMSDETTAYFQKIKEKHPDVQILSRGSSLKICMVAEGSADVYPRFAPTMEWDTAAGHAIVRQVGFDIFKTDEEKPLNYNKENLLNPWFIVKPVTT